MHHEYDLMCHHYLNGRLSDTEKIEFEQHLSICAICRSAVTDWMQIADAVREVAQEEAHSLPPLLNVPIRRKPMLHVQKPTRFLPNRVLLTLLIASLVLAWGIVMLSTSPESSPTMLVESIQQANTTTIVLATHTITAGEFVQADDILYYDLPNEFVPSEAMTTIESVVGSIANTPIICGQPILSTQLSQPDPNTIYYPIDPILDRLDLCEDISFAPLPDEPQLVNVPILTQDIQQPLTILDATMLTTRPYPAQLVHEFLQLIPEDFIGEMTLLDAPSDTLITPFIMAETWLDGGDFVAVPRDQILNDVTVIQFGDEVYVSSVFNFVEIDETALDTAESTESSSATVDTMPNMANVRPQINLNTFTDTVIFLSVTETNPDIIILGIPRTQRQTMTELYTYTYLVDAQIPFLLSHMTESNASIGNMMLPDNMVAFPIPISLLDSVAFGIQVGDRVDMIITDNNDSSQTSIEGLIIMIDYARESTMVAIQLEDLRVLLYADNADRSLSLRLITIED